MKTVFDTKEIFHVYASQSQYEGRTAQRSVFFRDRMIFSYGEHFPLGIFWPGLDIIFVNADKYSVTTTRHQSNLRTAIPSAISVVPLGTADMRLLVSQGQFDAAMRRVFIRALMSWPESAEATTDAVIRQFARLALQVGATADEAILPLGEARAIVASLVFRRAAHDKDAAANRVKAIKRNQRALAKLAESQMTKLLECAN